MAVALAAHETGAGPPVVILHGLFGSAGNWTAIARRLAERFHVLALDLRGHGGSPWAEPMEYSAMAEDVAAFIDSRNLAAVALIGHSLGGKVAMTLALTQPALVDRLVVVDIAPVAHAATNASYVEALRALDLRGVARRKEADDRLRPLVPDDAVRGFLLQNLVSGPDGLRWRVDLDGIAKGMAAISGFPAFPPGTVYPGPVLLIRGGRSDYVSDGDLAMTRRYFPDLRVASVAAAGHWVQAERPDDFLAAIGPFLRAGT